MAGRKHLRAKEVSSAGKENKPPKKAKTVSVASLFKPRTHLRKSSENDTRNALAPRSTGVSKQRASKLHFSSESGRSKKTESHPLYISFAEAANGYRQGVADHKAQQLEPVCNELLARVDSLDINGQPLEETNTLSVPEKEALIQADAELSKPLEEETFTIQNCQRDGTTTIEQFKLGHTMQTFEKLVERKRTEFAFLLKQLREVDVEIAAAYRDIIDGENVQGIKARRELDRDLEVLAQDALDAKEQTLAEIKQGRDDEQATVAEEKRQLDAFLKSLP